MSIASPLYIDKRIPRSPAWLAMTGKAHAVYLIFCCKRVVAKNKRQQGRSQYTTVNNGELTFSFKEAARYNIKKTAFENALDELVAYGFIDVAVRADEHPLPYNLYGFSDRWTQYGKPEFEQITRQRSNSGRAGFKKGNKFYERRTNFPVHVGKHGPCLSASTDTPKPQEGYACPQAQKKTQN